jgi:GNAT superfamily N-acetyltransferase
MTGPYVAEMMTERILLWRCLHGGALTAGSLDAAAANGQVSYGEFRVRNLALLRNLTTTYGACAVMVRSGDAIIGHLRFYPKAVRDLAAQGLGLCLQQEYPYGPADDFGRTDFPKLVDIADKTLLVHCMMLAPDGAGGESFRRRGIGRQMARTLIDWATANGWKALEATAYESLPVIYTISGQAGRSFWEDLGFRRVRTEREPALEEENDFVRKMRAGAAELGVDPASIANRYIMRRDL